MVSFDLSMNFVNVLLLTYISGLTLNQVKLQLAREEEARSRTSVSEESSDTTPSGFILLGMEIQDAQYVPPIHP